MKKSILNLGTIISKKSQKSIIGGTDRQCEWGTCPDSLICYYNQNGGTYCGDADPNVIAVKKPRRPYDSRVGSDG